MKREKQKAKTYKRNSLEAKAEQGPGTRYKGSFVTQMKLNRRLNQTKIQRLDNGTKVAWGGGGNEAKVNTIRQSQMRTEGTALQNKNQRRDTTVAVCS